MVCVCARTHARLHTDTLDSLNCGKLRKSPALTLTLTDNA